MRWCRSNARALFVLLLPTLVCCQPTELILGFFCFINCPTPHPTLPPGIRPCQAKGGSGGAFLAIRWGRKHLQVRELISRLKSDAKGRWIGEFIQKSIYLPKLHETICSPPLPCFFLFVVFSPRVFNWVDSGFVFFFVLTHPPPMISHFQSQIYGSPGSCCQPPLPSWRLVPSHTVDWGGMAWGGGGNTILPFNLIHPFNWPFLSLCLTCLIRKVAAPEVMMLSQSKPGGSLESWGVILLYGIQSK